MIIQELLKLTKGSIVVNRDTAKLLPNKTMTRRIVKLPDCKWKDRNGKITKIKVNIEKIYKEYSFLGEPYDKMIEINGVGEFEGTYYEKEFVRKFAKHQIGDVLWVREPAIIKNIDYEYNEIEYMFSDEVKSKIFIPDRFTKGYGENADEITAQWIVINKKVPNGCLKEMARYFIKITDVRVERLQDISEEDCIKEGINWKDNYCDNGETLNCYIEWFKNLWNTTAKAPYRWEDNPFVFVYEWEYIG